MDSLAEAEQFSVAGEVVIDVGAMASLGTRVTLRETRRGKYGDVGVVEALTVPVTDPGPEPPRPGPAAGDGP